VLELLSREGKKLSELLAPYRSLLHLRRDQLRGRTPTRRWPEIAARYGPSERTRAGRHLDGVSIDYDDWHFNVRSSNTEPLLRLCLESLVSVEDMERRRDEVLDLHGLPGRLEFVMRRSTQEYEAPARFDDLLEVFVRIARIGRTSTTFEFRVRKLEDGTPLVIADQVMVLIDADSRTPTEVPLAWRRVIEQFEGAL
jgi:acyl-CoA thioesterase FadM